jgi:hypothetical protein
VDRGGGIWVAAPTVSTPTTGTATALPVCLPHGRPGEHDRQSSALHARGPGGISGSAPSSA